MWLSAALSTYSVKSANNDCFVKRTIQLGPKRITYSVYHMFFFIANVPVAYFSLITTLPSSIPSMAFPPKNTGIQVLWMMTHTLVNTCAQVTMSNMYRKTFDLSWLEWPSHFHTWRLKSVAYCFSITSPSRDWHQSVKSASQDLFTHAQACSSKVPEKLIEKCWLPFWPIEQSSNPSHFLLCVQRNAILIPQLSLHRNDIQRYRPMSQRYLWMPTCKTMNCFQLLNRNLYKIQIQWLDSQYNLKRKGEL